MAVSINAYHDDLAQKFAEEKVRLENVLPKDVTIEHVGSTAIGIEGKNIVDILIGANSQNEMTKIRDILSENGYVEGHDTHPDRIFMATRIGETGEGDFHVHICPRNADSYCDLVLFRDYLRKHPEIAREYVEKKHECAKLAGYDRKKYKALKSVYIEKLLKNIKAD